MKNWLDQRAFTSWLEVPLYIGVVACVWQVAMWVT